MAVLRDPAAGVSAFDRLVATDADDTSFIADKELHDRSLPLHTNFSEDFPVESNLREHKLKTIADGNNNTADFCAKDSSSSTAESEEVNRKHHWIYIVNDTSKNFCSTFI